MPDRFIVPVSQWHLYPKLTAAILTAEQVAERWCCPICGGLNAAVPEHVFAYDGWCQHDACIQRRDTSPSGLRAHG
jgi:hypothetical protein